MEDNKAFIDSGILELYVLGQTSDLENTEIEERLMYDSALRTELEQIELALERYAFENAVELEETFKPLLLATLDYSDRLQKGEAITFPPILNENSKIEDFSEWLDRPDMQLPEDFANIYVKLIGHTDESTTAIVWMQDGAPPEVHQNTFERFLILEGSCEITVENELYSLEAGDYFGIPLFKTHHVRVTSPIPCKIILQRVAA
jgi:mannose-6-phosphate isomerase-like protein (cupin superfamily)